MTSKRISSEYADVTGAFLDANVLAKPVTRTLLIAGGPESGFRTVWSEAAEREAVRHLRARTLPLGVLRRRLGITLGPTGSSARTFAATSESDRQILADACAVGSHFLVTEDVDDFGEADLVRVGVSAVNPDLFLAAKLTRKAYRSVVDLFVRRQTAPATTAAQFHRAIARQHPLLFARHADFIDIAPAPRRQQLPTELFLGARCLSCDQLVKVIEHTRTGRCESCRA